MRKVAVSIVAVAALVAGFLYFRWSSAIHQPLGFSHAGHVQKGIPCATCHDSKVLDSLPSTTACLSCHTDRKFPQDPKWVRVYRVAPDIVFSHSLHLRDDCTVCHVEITSGKRWVHESRFTMDFCMTCHTQRQANNACGACHKNM